MDSKDVRNGLKNWSKGPQCPRVQSPRKYPEQPGDMLTLTCKKRSPCCNFPRGQQGQEAYGDDSSDVAGRKLVGISVSELVTRNLTRDRTAGNKQHLAQTVVTLPYT